MTREDILRAAAHIFQKKGYHATSMQDIAEAVDLQKGSLYHHVSGKQEILLNILNEALDMIVDRLQSVLDEEVSPSQKLRQAMRIYLVFLTENPSLCSVLLLEHRSLEPELRKLHIPRRDRVDAIWREIISEGIAAGEFCTPDPALTAKALLGVLNWTITWYREDGPLAPNEIAEQFSDLFLEGLAVERSPASV